LAGYALSVDTSATTLRRAVEAAQLEGRDAAAATDAWKRCNDFLKNLKA